MPRSLFVCIPKQMRQTLTNPPLSLHSLSLLLSAHNKYIAVYICPTNLLIHLNKSSICVMSYVLGTHLLGFFFIQPFVDMVFTYIEYKPYQIVNNICQWILKKYNALTSIIFVYFKKKTHKRTNNKQKQNKKQTIMHSPCPKTVFILVHSS